MLRPPKLPTEFNSLMDKIDAAIKEGAVYSPPVSGSNRQSIQAFDLNGDGVDEAIVFLKTAQEKQLLNIQIYKKQDEEYVLFDTILGFGEMVNNVQYTELTGDKQIEMIISYKVGNVKALSVFKYTDEKMVEVLNTNYSSYAVTDFVKSGQKNLLIIQLQPADLTGTIELYQCVEEVLVKTSTAPLSKDILQLDRIVSGSLADKTPALYVVSTYQDTNNIITDVFINSEDGIKNLSLNESQGVSTETARSLKIYAVNIDNDPSNAIDIPRPRALPPYNSDQPSEPHYLVDWRDFDSSGKISTVLTTYQSTNDGWLLVIPDRWDDRLTVNVTQMADGTLTTFALLGLDKSTRFVPMDVLKIYFVRRRLNETVVSGDNIILSETDGYYMLAEIIQPVGDEKMAMTKEELRKSVNFTKSEWLTGVLP